MRSVVKCNADTPTSKTHIFTTSVDQQPGILFEVFEGEYNMAKNNHLLQIFRWLEFLQFIKECLKLLSPLMSMEMET